MIFNIPQFIDKEDKIVGPLTAKQLGWLFSGGVIVLVFWGTLDTQAFYLSIIPIIGIALAFAFYRPYNQSLLAFIFSIFIFIFRNKIYLWKRMPENELPAKKVSPQKNLLLNVEEKFNEKKITEISKLLDQEKSNGKIINK